MPGHGSMSAPGGNGMPSASTLPSCRQGGMLRAEWCRCSARVLHCGRMAPQSPAACRWPWASRACRWVSMILEGELGDGA